MLNPYQEKLAERSLVVETDSSGETWSFRWYIDPISNGLAKWHQYHVHVSKGYIAFYGLAMPRDDEEELAMNQAMEFVKKRYEGFGLDEEDTENRD